MRRHRYATRGRQQGAWTAPGFRLLSSGLRQCLTAAESGEAEPMCCDEMEKLFLSLA